jgi:hypothetical protein
MASLLAAYSARVYLRYRPAGEQALAVEIRFRRKPSRGPAAPLEDRS